MKYDFAVRNRAGETLESGERVGLGLEANRTRLPADGSAFAICHFAQETPGEAQWSVNGVLHSEPLVQDAESGLWCSEIEVTASTPGPVDVSCNGSTLTLEAV